MNTFRAVIPGISGHVTLAVQAPTAEAAKVRLEAKMLKRGFPGTLRMWKEAGQKVERVTVKPEDNMLAAVWRPVLDRQVIPGWDTFARGVEEAQRKIGEAMDNEGYHSLKVNWLADGGLLEPVDETVREEA
jgi:hypothetical protein